MKTIKKYFKVVLCFLAFAVSSILFAFTPTMSAVYAENSAAAFNDAVNEIKSIKMQTRVNPSSKKESEKQFLIPVAQNSFSGNTVVRVIDPAGTSHDYTVGGNSDVNDYAFFADSTSTASLEASKQVPAGYVKVNALNNGNYQVVYIATLGTGATAKVYYSNIYNVEVENVSYELDFNDANGLEKLYKSEVAIGTEIVVFDAAAKIVDGTETRSIEANSKYVKVTKDGAIQVLNDTANNSVFKSKTVNSETVYYIDTTEADNSNVASVYTIEYTFSDSTNRPTKTFTIKAVAASEFKADKELVISTPTLPTMELGQVDVKLPKLTVNRGDEKNVAHNVTKIVIEKESDSNVKCELTNNDYTFDFTTASFSNVESYEDMVGIYKVSYTVVDAYGNTKTYTTRTKTAITATSKPKAYLAFDYETTAVAGVQDTNGFKVKEGTTVDTKYAETSLKVSYGYSEILLPALYGTDNLTNTEDLMFVRYLRNSNTRRVYYIDNLKYENGKLVTVNYGETGYNYALVGDGNTTKTGTPNVAQAFKFSASGDDQEFAGNYYLEYRVVSKSVKERTGYVYATGTTEYSIEVLKDATRSQTDATAPKVEITNLKNTSIRPEDGTTVKLTASDEYDTRVKKAVFYYTDKIDNKGTAEETDDVVVNVDNATLKADIETAYNALLSQSNVNIIDSEKFVEEMTKLGYSNFTWVEESETSNSYTVGSFEDLAENDATSIKVVAVALNDNTTDKVAVDTVTLTLKNTSENIAPEAKILEGTYLDAANKNSNKIAKDGSSVYGQGKEIELPTVKFEDTNDANLNLSVMYYVTTVDGDKVVGPETKAGLDYRYPANVSYGNNIINGGTITTSEIGTYYVVYTAIDDAGNTTLTNFSFEVVDSSKPVLSVNVVSSDEFTQTGNTITAEVGSTLDFEVLLRSGDGKNTDYTNRNDAVVSVEVRAEGNLDYRPSGNAENSYTFNSVGSYVVTIKGSVGTEANSDYRSADNKVIYIEITKPNVVWLEEFDIPQYAAKNAEVYLPDVAASHNSVVSVKVTAPGGATPVAGEAKKVIVEGITVWMFKTNENSKGTYKVTYTATSKYSTIEKTFSIKVGDNVAPVFKTAKENELKQDIIYSGNDISYKVEMNKSNKTFVVTAKVGDETIYSYDLGLTISDKDDSGNPNNNMSWSNLTYTVTGDNVTGDAGNYTITGTGKVTLTLTIEDSYDNVATKVISFNVVTESEVEEDNDTVVGTVLIIVSLVILAGVILFFIATGNGKRGFKKSKGVKEVKESNSEEVVVEESKEEVKEEVVEEAAAEETESEEAKTGDVE